jgi:hypothetical protein
MRVVVQRVSEAAVDVAARKVTKELQVNPESVLPFQKLHAHRTFNRFPRHDCNQRRRGMLSKSGCYVNAGFGTVHALGLKRQESTLFL